MCDFITQSSTLPFFEQFANGVVVFSAKGYLWAPRGQWLKRKYPEIKTGKKPTWKLHCDVWKHLTDVYVSFQYSGCNIFLFKSAQGYSLAQRSWQWQRKYPQMKTRKNFLRHYLVMFEFISQSSIYVSWSIPLTLSLRNMRRFSLDPIETSRKLW